MFEKFDQSKNSESEEQQEGRTIPVEGEKLRDIRNNFNFDNRVPELAHTESIEECVVDILSGEAPLDEEYKSGDLYDGHVPSKTFDSPIKYLQEHNSLSVLNDVAEEHNIDLSHIST